MGNDNSSNNQQLSIDQNEEEVVVTTGCGKLKHIYGEKMMQEIFFLNEKGKECLVVGNIKSAVGYFENALKIIKERCYQDDLETKCFKPILLNNIGITCQQLGEYEKALESYQECLKILENEEYRSNEFFQEICESIQPTLISNIASTCFLLGKYEKCLELGKEVLKMDKENGDKEGEGISLCNMGEIYRELGEYRKAVELYLESLEIFKELENKYYVALTLNKIGFIHRLVEEYNKALVIQQESLKIFQEIGSKSGEAMCLNSIALVNMENGELGKVVTGLQESLAIWKELGNKDLEASLLNNIAIIHSSLGESDKALELHKQSLKIFKELGQKNNEAKILRNIGCTLGMNKKYFESISRINDSIKLFEECKVEYEVRESNNWVNFYKGEKEEYLKSNIWKEINNNKKLRLSDFEIIRRVGERVSGGKDDDGRRLSFHGANSQVYLCKLKGYEILFILKVSYTYSAGSHDDKESKSFLETPLIIDQHKKEFIPVERLSRHPNILFNFSCFVEKIDRSILIGFKGLNSVFLSDKTMFVLTYYMKGNLKEYIKNYSGEIEELIFLKFMRDILSSLCHFHRNYFVHRDIKPANILLTPDERAVVSDFGTHLDVINTKSFKSKTGKEGTPFFQPPEILNGKDNEELDYSKTDVFSAGIVAYELLTKTNEAFLNYHHRKDEDYKGITSGKYSKEVKDLVKNMVKCNINERIDCYQALNEVRNIIDLRKKKVKWWYQTISPQQHEENQKKDKIHERVNLKLNLSNTLNLRKKGEEKLKIGYSKQSKKSIFNIKNIAAVTSISFIMISAAVYYHYKKHDNVNSSSKKSENYFDIKMKDIWDIFSGNYRITQLWKFVIVK